MRTRCVRINIPSLKNPHTSKTPSILMILLDILHDLLVSGAVGITPIN